MAQQGYRFHQQPKSPGQSPNPRLPRGSRPGPSPLTTAVTQSDEPPEWTSQPLVANPMRDVRKLRSAINRIQMVMKRSVAAHAKTLLKKRQGAGRQVRPGGEPGDARVSPEPGFLAAGEAAGRPAGLLAGLLRGPLAVKRAKHLLIAEGARGGPALAQADGGQGARLRLEPGRPHPVDPRLDPQVEFGPVDAEPDLDGGAAGVVAGQGGAERTAGQLHHLERADDPAAVRWQDRGRRDRVDGLQALVEAERSVCCELGVEARSDLVVRAGEVKVAQGRPDVETGTAD